MLKPRPFQVKGLGALALAAAIVLTLGSSGCFKSPTDPMGATGTGGTVPVNSADNQTTDIRTAASLAGSRGFYLSVVDQSGNALSPSVFANGSFQVMYNGHRVSSGSLRIGTPSSSGGNLSSSLVLDYSGSMSVDIPNLETAATAFVNQMQPADAGEIIKFDDTINVAQPFTTSKDALRAAILLNLGLGGSTALFDAVYRGILDTSTQMGQRAVVAFTDGGENASTLMTSLDQVEQEARAHGVPVFTIGLGTSADQITLQDLAIKTGGLYYYAPTSLELSTIYQQISHVFSSSMLVTWPSFTYVSGATITVTVTYICATGTYTSTVTLVLP